MLRCDDGALFARGGKHGAAGENAGSPEDSSRALVERGDGVVGEELGLSAGDGEVMGDIGGPVIALEGVEVDLREGVCSGSTIPSVRASFAQRLASITVIATRNRRQWLAGRNG
jgi:hypothetical protein